MRKKLIEVSIPLESISAAASKEKSIRHGQPSTLHVWWSRKPLAASRAILFAQLVDDPSSWPEHFPTAESCEAERKRLHNLIVRMVPWEASSDPTIVQEVRWEIARSFAWGLNIEPPSRNDNNGTLSFLQTHAPAVFDPFSGGGSIPLEAQRLGLRSYGSDINPVAVLLGKSLVQIPPKFSGRAPVNPESRRDRRFIDKKWQRAFGLAEDVKWYGRWIGEQAQERLNDLYPDYIMPNGSRAKILAWKWARTVRSPDPAAKGAMVPLVSSWLLSTKGPVKTWIEPVIDPAFKDGYRIEIRSGHLSSEDEAALKKGTIGRSAGGICILTGASMPFSYIREQGQTSGLGYRLLATIVESNRRREFMPPTREQEEIALSARPSWRPDADLPHNPRDFKTPNYGMTTFSSLFSERQLSTLSPSYS